MGGKAQIPGTHVRTYLAAENDVDCMDVESLGHLFAESRTQGMGANSLLKSTLLDSKLPTLTGHAVLPLPRSDRCLHSEPFVVRGVQMIARTHSKAMNWAQRHLSPMDLPGPTAECGRIGLA